MCECELCLVTPWSDCTMCSHVATLRGLWAQAGNITSSLLANMYTLITVCPALLLALLVHPGALLLPEAEAWAGSCSWALTNSKKESQHSESEPTLQPHTVQSRPELRLWQPPWQAVFKLGVYTGSPNEVNCRTVDKFIYGWMQGAPGTPFSCWFFLLSVESSPGPSALLSESQS